MPNERETLQQASFDFVFATDEEKRVVEYNQNIESIIAELDSAPSDELLEVTQISNNYQPIIPSIDINDDRFLASQWLEDNLKAIEIANNYALTNTITNEDKQLLLRYHGWGGLSEVFDERKTENGQFSEARARLKELLNEKEYREAAASTLTAMYTPLEIVDVLHSGLDKLGVFNSTRKVNVLDPSAGTGRMFYNLANIQPKLIELDPVTSKISAAIFGSENVINSGFERSKVKDNVFDVVIANPPFGDFKVGDSKISPVSIHNYFMMKSIDSLREGGIGAFVVSRYFLDTKNDTSREYIADKADLLAAYRLPSGIFPDTEVVADLLFFQKNTTSQEKNRNWVNTTVVIPSEHFNTKLSNAMVINSYFLENQQNILGELSTKQNQYGDMIVTPVLGSNTKNEIFETIKSKIDNVFKPIVNYDSLEVIDEFFKATPQEITDEKTLEFKELKDFLVDLIASEKDPSLDEETIELKRSKLNEKYDSIVETYGYINLKQNREILAKNNIEHILSLEEVVKQSRGKIQEVAKCKLLQERIYHPVAWDISTPEEALMYSINTTGQVDPIVMANILKSTPEDVLNPLIEDGKIFFNPRARNYEIAAKYLSGNVVRKLDEAEEAGLETNVKALRSIQPEIIPFEQIGIPISAPWVPPEILIKFAKDNFDVEIKANYIIALGQWSVDCPGWGVSSFVRQTYATSRCDFDKILESTITGKTITVHDKIFEDGKEKTITNTEETRKVQDCQQAIIQLYEEWLPTLPMESQRELESIYNRKFNNTVIPNYDGSLYNFSSDKSSRPLYAHQKNAIVRSLMEGRALYDHVVGAGKTRVMISTLLEGKKLGLWEKPIVVVPNHLISQWGLSISEDYPGSNICLATVDKMESKNRKEFLSQIMTNEYDLIVMGHSHFKHIGLNPATYEYYIRNQIHELELAATNDNEGVSVKHLQRAIKSLQTRLDKQIEKNKQNAGAITLDEIGIDAIAVDEAHLFKNLSYATSKQIAGLNDPKGSQRATDLLLKMHHIQEKYGRGTFLATGTPFSNSICEIYVMQRYLDNETLEEKGIASFDAWVDTYGQITKNWEIAATGQGYQLKERLSSFNNCPELAIMYRRFSDVFTTEDLKSVGHIKVPTPIYEKSVDLPSDIQKDHFRDIINRVNKIQSGSVDPSEDNMLKLTSFAKNSALDPRIINSTYSDFENSKVNRLVDNVISTYNTTQTILGTQVIFCDSSTPKESSKANKNAISKSDDGEVDLENSITSEIDELAQGDSRFTIYEDIRTKLIKKGIPAEQIAFIHDYNSDKQKQELYDSVNLGQIRVVLGSTSKLGAGTNMQKRLSVLHHLDVPWRPSDLIQREGRIIRQGNINEDVKIYRYITEGTYDARSWQIIENKAKIAQQFTSSMDSKVRKIADVGMQTMNAAELKASATGNPYALYYVMLDQELSDLKRSKRTYENTLRVAQRFIEDNTHESISLKEEKRLNNIRQFEAVRDKYRESKSVSDEENLKLKNAFKQGIIYTYGRDFIFTEYKGMTIRYHKSDNEFILELGDKEFLLRDNALKYSGSECENFSPRGLFKRIDNILNLQLEKRKQEIINQSDMSHKDLDRFLTLVQKPFIHQERLIAVEEDVAHCQSIMEKLKEDLNYTENWIPLSIKDQIKEDMYPKGYNSEVINELQHEALLISDNKTTSFAKISALGVEISLNMAIEPGGLDSILVNSGEGAIEIPINNNSFIGRNLWTIEKAIKGECNPADSFWATVKNEINSFIETKELTKSHILFNNNFIDINC